MSPCCTSSTMLKSSVSPSAKLTFTFVFIMAVTVFGVGRRRVEIASSFLCECSQALVKSTNDIVASTPSRIRRIIKIRVLSLSIRKTIWFFVGIFSILGSIRFGRYHHHHHHHVVRLARISQTLSLHVSLSYIASDRSSGLYPVLSHNCRINVRAGRPAFDWPYAGVHRSTSLMISSWFSGSVRHVWFV